MGSPFPGMDPYLERHWGDVHSRLVIYASDQLKTKLPRDLRARVQERIFVEAPHASSRSIFPDVRIVEQRPAAQANTCIEFLSPSNKLPGEGQKLYLRKQAELNDAGVNSVEIDLIRSGRRTFAIPPEWIPSTHRSSYGACVRRGTSRGRFELYRFLLRQPLPAIRIPLRSSDSDVLLELQPLVSLCYENGGDDSIDYECPLDPPLDADDQMWAVECARRSAVDSAQKPHAP